MSDHHSQPPAQKPDPKKTTAHKREKPLATKPATPPAHGR